MKTIKFIFSLLVSLVLVAPAFAEEEETAVYVYAESVSAVVGEEVELPIVLKNTFNVRGFEFYITLPTGVSFVEKGSSIKITKVNEALGEEWQIASALSDSKKTARVFGFFTVNEDKSIPAGEGTLLTLSLTADDELTSSGAEIKITSQVFTDIYDHEYSAVVPEGTEPTTPTIIPVTYPDGYSLTITPFVLDLNEPMSIPFVLTSASNLLSIEYTVSISKLFVDNELVDYEIDDKKFQKLKYTNAIGYLSSGATISITRKSSNVISACSNNEIGNLLIGYDADKIPNSVYVVSLKNIKFVDKDGKDIYVAPNAADIYVGEGAKAPVTNGEVAFHGIYSDASLFSKMNAALPTEDKTVTTLDLTAVTSIPEGTSAQTISLANPNTIIRTTENFPVSNAKNVVIGKTCAELELKDGYSFANTKKFTATKASYSRTMSGYSWGTLCLPFNAAMTGADVWTLEEVTAKDVDGNEETGVMKFKQASSNDITANKPYVIKKTANNVTFTAASNTEIPVTPDACTEEVATNWYLNGTAIDATFSEADCTAHSYYYINGDKFWKASKFHVAPFRAYFEYSNPEAAPAKFRIEEETNGIEAIEAEAETGVIYDLQGRAVKAPQAGQFYIQGSKKYIVK